ncbi:hypothetical protein CRUP_017748 [Coryphaenoides rupestris]|nr:hypothetical protein CRUP_017748 [Coryphaenoides rupestris]
MFTFSLTVVRHGETQYNRDKLLQGQGVDTTLSETGLRQAQAVGQYLRGVPFNTTEQILRNACSSTVEPILEPLLRERGFGVAEGRPKEDLKNMANVRLRFKAFLKVLFQQMMDEHGDAAASSATNSCDGSTTGTPGHGSVPEDGLEGVGVHVLAVSHGAYIRVAVRHLLEELGCVPPAGARAGQLLSPCPNTGISRFVLTLRRTPVGGSVELAAGRCVFTNRKDHLAMLKEC